MYCVVGDSFVSNEIVDVQSRDGKCDRMMKEGGLCFPLGYMSGVFFLLLLLLFLLFLLCRGKCVHR